LSLLVGEAIIPVIDSIVFNLLARPFVKFGRTVAFIDIDARVKAVDFGMLPLGLVGLSPTPWKRACATRSRHWYHLDKSTMERLVVDEAALPIWRDGGGSYPGTWLIEEHGGEAILGANAVGGAHPSLGVESKSGFHFFRLTGDSLAVVNQDPIPYLIYASWREADALVLCGMAQRSNLDDATGDGVTLGRPALIRCDLAAGRWEEFSLMDTPGGDAASLHPIVEAGFSDPTLQFECWIGSGQLRTGERIMIGAMAEKDLSFFDLLFALSPRPVVGDYHSLAFVSRENAEVVHAEPDSRVIHTILTPEKTLFVVCRAIDGSRSVSTLRQLYVLDLYSHGLEFQKMNIVGLDDDVRFSKFTAAYFGAEAFFGCLSEETNDYFLKSQDGLNWSVLGSSSTIECMHIDELFPN
jgi:hypothetical protein